MSDLYKHQYIYIIRFHDEDHVHGIMWIGRDIPRRCLCWPIFFLSFCSSFFWGGGGGEGGGIGTLKIVKSPLLTTHCKTLILGAISGQTWIWTRKMKRKKTLVGCKRTAQRVKKKNKETKAHNKRLRYAKENDRTWIVSERERERENFNLELWI